jgi:hypothetical protein
MADYPEKDRPDQQFWNALDNMWAEINDLHHKVDEGYITAEDVAGTYDSSVLQEMIAAFNEAGALAKDIKLSFPEAMEGADPGAAPTSLIDDEDW